MLRTIGAVLLGYIVMFVVVFVLMTGAYLGLGAERAFRPPSYEVSGLWTMLSIFIGLAAAVGGDIVAARSPAGSTGCWRWPSRWCSSASSWPSRR